MAIAQAMKPGYQKFLILGQVQGFSPKELEKL